MKADFHVRNYENSTLYDSFESDKLVLTPNRKVKYLIKINPTDSVAPKQMVLAYKVFNNGMGDKNTKPHWIYVDDILSVNNGIKELFAVQYEGHENHINYAEFPVDEITTELGVTLKKKKWQSLNCLTHTLEEQKAYQLSRSLSAHLLNFYHDNKSPVVDEYSLEEDLLKHKAVKSDSGWQLKIHDYQVDLLLQSLDDNNHPEEIDKLQAEYQDESIAYMNLYRQSVEVKLNMYESAGDEVLVSEPEDLENLKEIAEMLINSGSVELFVFALRKANANEALVGTLNLTQVSVID